MAEWSVWIFAIVVNKYLLSLSVAASAGSIFILSQTQESTLRNFSWRYGLVGSVLGLLLAVLDFFLQVGLFADTGWAGLVDRSFILMIWDSPLGTQFLFRTLGFIVLMTIFLCSLRQAQVPLGIWLIALIALVLLSFACVQAGHTVEQTLGTRLILGLHFLLGLWWMGCLWPLARSCQSLNARDLQVLMQRFGTIASVLVPILLLAGLVLAYVLTGSLQHLFTSTHGQLLLLKISLVLGLLGLAAYNKLKLVPYLSKPEKVLILQRSIYYEMLLGLVVLLLTAMLSSMFGPAILMAE